MKTLFTSLFLVTINLTSFSQISQTNLQTTETQKTDKLGSITTVAYRLFPTENMWTFIKLNTRTGQMWQIQFDVQGENRYEVYLSLESLVNFESEANDRFTLYPTQNMYTFILLDQYDGRTWQVQWATESKNRGIIPIR